MYDQMLRIRNRDSVSKINSESRKKVIFFERIQQEIMRRHDCLQKGQIMLPLKYLFENYELAKECLKRYDHSEENPDEMLRHFRISSNAIYPFYADENGKVCYLRLSPTAEKDPSDVVSELHFITWLSEHGYPIMKPYPMKDGKLHDVISTRWGTYNVSCFEEVSGETLEDTEGSLELAYGYGRTLAELHNLSEAYPYSDERRNHTELLTEIKERLIKNRAPGIVLAQCDTIADELSRLEIRKDNYGLIHYDFEPDNVLYDKESGQFGVIDPDDSIRCFYALDVVRAVDAMDDVAEEELTEQAVNAFFEGYRSKRIFSQEQAASLPLMRKLVSLQEYATILHVLSEPTEEEPEWMTQIKAKLNRKTDRIEASFSQT